MKKILIFFILTLFGSQLLAQKHDYVWQLGDSADNPQDSLWGRTVIDFNHSLSRPRIKYNGFPTMGFQLNNSAISDKDGNFLFTYNGYKIESHSGFFMKNGYAVGPLMHDNDLLLQGSIILPIPGDTNKYVLLYGSPELDVNLGMAVSYDLFYSNIDMNKDGGWGEVIEKNSTLVHDTLGFGGITAVKHANGLDWWILVPRYQDGKFYKILLSSSGLKIDTINQYTSFKNNGFLHVYFSPNGNKYAKLNDISNIDGEVLSIYDFDRCTGQLGNPTTIHEYNEGAGGIAFSPDSKLLYLMAWDKVYQYDLEAPDIGASKLLVAERDEYRDTVDTHADTFYVKPSFFMGMLAADGKIYITSYGNNHVYHTIERPNVRGVGCRVNQHSVKIPTVKQAFPNFPNYRLGPIDGSICDSLGINNVPLSRFRYDQDTSNSLSFDFIDLSNYEPAEWHWDFGDGTTSQDTSPTHLYAGIGVYPVCLTVTNQYGSSTMCDTLYLGVVATQEVDIQVDVHVWPNPFSDYLMVSLYDYYPQNAYIYFFDITGRFLRKERVRNGINELDVGGFPKGMVFYEVRDGVVLLRRGKVVRN